MAKIYETEKDVERDRLSREAKSERNSEEVLRNSGISALIMGWMSSDIGRLREAEDYASKRPLRFGHTLDKVLTGMLLAIGGLSLGRSFMKRKNAKEAETALEKLGPEQVVLPQDAEGSNHSNSHRASPKSLLQHAVRPEAGPLQAR